MDDLDLLVLELLGTHSRIGELHQACIERRSTERVLDLCSGQVSLRDGSPDGVPPLSDTHLVTFLGPKARLILIGAGDLARYVSQMALSMGFEVVVCDPRKEHHAACGLTGVTLSPEMPDDLVIRMHPDTRTAVVALTHDPKLDDLALIEALQSEAFYVGAIGSRRNNAQRRARLREHFGLTERALLALHGPAGLYIGSKTPAEIALSIMAEVVAAKNGVRADQPPASVAVGKLKQPDRYLPAPTAGCTV